MIINCGVGRLAALIGALTLATGCTSETDVNLLPTVQLTGVFGESGTVDFGSIDDLAMLNDGSVVVLDGMNTRIVVLDPSTGGVVASWGTEGQGPREFRSVRGIWVTVDNEIGAVDAGNRRVSFWSSDGEFKRSKPLDLIPLHVVSQNGVAFIKAAAEDGQGLGFFEIGSDGSLAEVPAAAFLTLDEGAISCRFCPATAVGSGRFIVGAAGTDYRVSLIDSSGVIEQWVRHLDPVRQDSATIQRLRQALGPAAARAGTTPNVPEHRPWFPRHAFGIDADGRIWVLRAAEVDAGSSFDVFVQNRDEPMGTTRVPRQEEILGIRVFGRTILAYGRNPAGIPVVLEYEVQEVPQP